MQHIWRSVVRDYELDLQGIVNNAVYLNYFQNARNLQFQEVGLDWKAWHREGRDFVLVRSEIDYKGSLREEEPFKLITTTSRVSRLRILFHQQIFSERSGKLLINGKLYGVCVDIKTGKPCVAQELVALLG